MLLACFQSLRGPVLVAKALGTAGSQAGHSSPLEGSSRFSFGGRPETLVYIVYIYKAGTCDKQNQGFSVVAKDPQKHGERAGEKVT